MTAKAVDVAAIEAALVPILAEPRASAVLFDLDGTLAPIVSRPEDSAIPEAVRAALERIAARYPLTAIVTGRAPSVARSIVGLDSIAYAGNHGFEVLMPGASEANPSPALGSVAGVAASFAGSLDGPELERGGVEVEDKGPIVALHWRRAKDQNAAIELVDRIADHAEAAGLVTHRGRKVLELRPAVAIDKGVAVAGLLGGTPVRAVLYAGDDRTDLDAFAELRRRRERGELDALVLVGIDSQEGPPEIVERADLVADGPAALIPLLEALAG